MDLKSRSQNLIKLKGEVDGSAITTDKDIRVWTTYFYFIVLNFYKSLFEWSRGYA